MLGVRSGGLSTKANCPQFFRRNAPLPARRTTVHDFNVTGFMRGKRCISPVPRLHYRNLYSFDAFLPHAEPMSSAYVEAAIDEVNNVNNRKPLSYDIIEALPEDIDYEGDAAEIWALSSYPGEANIEKNELPPLALAYPLANGFVVPKDFQEKLIASMIVRVLGTYYLVPRGGHRSVPWEMCETCMNLGYYPPVHLSLQLTETADSDTSNRYYRVLAASNASIRNLVERYQKRVSDNERRLSVIREKRPARPTSATNSV